MTKQRFEVVIFHEYPHKERKIIKRLYVWVDMESEREPNEYVYARTQLSEGV